MWSNYSEINLATKFCWSSANEIILLTSSIKSQLGFYLWPKTTIPAGRTDQLGIIPTQPSLAGVGAWAELGNNVMSKRQIKETIKDTVTLKNKAKLLSFKKVADRVSDDPSDNNYLGRMGLTHSRIWIRYRARAVKGVKANHKRSWKNNLECRQVLW